MRVVDNNKERLPKIDALKSAGNALEILDPGGDDFVGNLERLRRADRGKNVVNIDAPDEPRRNLHFAFRRLRRERESAKMSVEISSS